MSPEPRLRSIKDWIWYLFCGFSMGAADLVPGISGGTIAFIMGFYEPLIDNIKSINFKILKALCFLRFKEVEEALSLKFLFALVVGIISALALLSQTIAYILNHEVYRTYLFSAFMGLILASSLFCFRKMQTWDLSYIIPLLCGVIIAFFLTHLSFSADASVNQHFDVEVEVRDIGEQKIENYDVERKMLLDIDKETLSAMLAKGLVNGDTPVYDKQNNEKTLVEDVVTDVAYPIVNGWLILCGAIGISAMLLPGLSGSYLLTILGAYPIVIEALADVTAGLSNFSIDRDAILVLGNLFVGIVMGAALFSRAISWLFHHYHDMTIALLIGFMLGALPVVWPFWQYQYRLMPLKLEKGVKIEPVAAFIPDFDSWMLWSALAVAIAAFLFVIVVEMAASKKNGSR